jgi:hypothetical protein
MAVLENHRMFFNQELSICRVKVEHTIGLLKNRLLYMKDINIIIKDKQSMQRLINRVTCCVVLHNMLLGEPVPPEWLQYDEEDTENEELAENNPLMQPTNEANQ